MSSIVEISFTCPKCGCEQVLTAYSSVNVTLDPDLREKIFADELNQAACAECDFTAKIDIELLYHDMDRRFAVWYYPEGTFTEERREALEALGSKWGTRRYLIETPPTFTWDDFKQTIQNKEKEFKDKD